MKKKISKRAGFWVTFGMALGIVSHNQINDPNSITQENGRQVLEQKGGHLTRYISKKLDEGRLEDLKEDFFWYKMTKDNPDLEQLYKSLTSYNFYEMTQDQAYGFKEIGFALLRKISEIQHSEYAKGSPKYNEIQQRVIPDTKEYFKIGLEILKVRYPQNYNIQTYLASIK